MVNSAFQCPNCGNQMVQSVAAVANAGVWAGATVTHGTVVGSGNFSSVGLSTIQMGQTSLAAIIGPPAKPSIWRQIVPGCILLGIIQFFLSVFWSSSVGGPTGPLVIVSIILIVIGGPIIGWFMQARERAKFPIRMATWQRLIYCGRCHQVYDPATMRSVSADQMAVLLDF